MCAKTEAGQTSLLHVFQKLPMQLMLAFKHLRCHPSCTSLVVGHVGLNVARSPKVTYLQHRATGNKEQAETNKETKIYSNARRELQWLVTCETT